jgi:hypothetical protein
MVKRRTFGLIVLVGLLLTIYTFTNSSRFHVVDEVSLFGVTESLGLRGAVDTNAIAWTQWVNSPGEVLGAFGPEGDVYSKKGVGPAVVALPWYLVLHLLGRMGIILGLVQSTLLWNGFVTALTAGLLWLVAVRLGYDDYTGASLALLFGLATIAWPYANQFFGEPLSAFGLLLAFYGLVSWGATGRLRWPIIGGVGAALVLATVTAHVLLIGLLAAYAFLVILRVPSLVWSGPATGAGGDAQRAPYAGDMMTATKGVIAFLTPVVLAGSLLLVYNYGRFGNPFSTGYHFAEGEGFSTPIYQGFYGLVFSPYRGLFWFTPLFLVSVVAYVPFLRRHRAEGILIGLMSLTLVALYSMWWMWWAGFAWGPRFLVPMTPFWVLVLAPVQKGLQTRLSASLSTKAGWRELLAAPGWTGWSLIVLAGVSFLVQLAAVSVNFVNFEIQLRSRYPTDWSNPLAFGPPAQNLLKFWDSPVFGQLKLIDLGIAANSDLAWLWDDGNIQLLIVAVGGAVLVTLLGMALTWLYDGLVGAPEADNVPSRPIWMLAVVLPILFVGLWSTEASRNPHFGDVGRGYRGAIDDICKRVEDGDVIVTIAPYAYQIPMNWLGSECKPVPPVLGYATDSLQQPEAQSVMNRTLNQYNRIWFVTGGLPPNDPENLLERWLADTAFKASDDWHDDFRLLVYATPLALEGTERKEMNVPLVGTQTSRVTITGTRMPDTAAVGSVVPVEVNYRLDGTNEANLRWFVQILTMEGFPVALLDTAPDDGYTLFSSLPPQEELTVRAGLLLPTEMPVGEYQVIAGLYNPDSPDAERLRATNGDDHIQLGTVFVELGK